MTGSSFEITGSGTDEGLSFTDDTLTASPADAAVGVHDDGSGFHEDLQKTFLMPADRLPGWPVPPENEPADVL